MSTLLTITAIFAILFSVAIVFCVVATWAIMAWMVDAAQWDDY